MHSCIVSCRIVSKNRRHKVLLAELGDFRFDCGWSRIVPWA